MAVRHRIGNHFQYQTATEGAAGFTWLSTWVLDHASEIRPHLENGHSLVPLIPPHPEGCQSQLNCVYHMENDTEQEFLASFQEVVDALQNGSVVTGDCDTEFGQEEE